MGSGEFTEVRAAVARVCVEEPQMRASLERGGDASPLDRLIAEVREGLSCPSCTPRCSGVGTQSVCSDPPGTARGSASGTFTVVTPGLARSG